MRCSVYIAKYKRLIHVSNYFQEERLGGESMDETQICRPKWFLDGENIEMEIWPGTFKGLEQLKYSNARMVFPQILTTTDRRSYRPGISHVAVWISKLHST